MKINYTHSTACFSELYDKPVKYFTIESAVSSLEKPDKKLSFRTLIDTGCSSSQISKFAAEKLGLKPSFNLKKGINTYLVYFHLPFEISIPMEVIEFNNQASLHFNLIIGMDILRKGVLTIKNGNDKTCLTFEMPITVEEQKDLPEDFSKDYKITEPDLNNSFSIKYNHIIRKPIFNCEVSTYEDPKKLYSIRAIWDTGAKCCYISESFAKKMDLKPHREESVLSMEGLTVSPEYTLNLHLPNDFNRYVRVIQFLDHKELDFAIGLDVINLGSFIMMNDGSGTIIKFNWLT